MRRDEGKPFRANTFEFGRSIIKKEITKNLSNASVIITSARETYVSLEQHFLSLNDGLFTFMRIPLLPIFFFPLFRFYL